METFGPDAFDKILVDARSGIGLIRRNDIRSTIKRVQGTSLQAIQLAILDNLSKGVRKVV